MRIVKTVPTRLIDRLKKYGGPVARGFVAQFVPDILKGTIIKVMKEREVDVSKLIDYAERDASLFDLIDPEHKVDMKLLSTYGGDMSWFSTDWVIELLRDDFPDLHSLILANEVYRQWLERQVGAIIKAARP